MSNEIPPNPLDDEAEVKAANAPGNPTVDVFTWNKEPAKATPVIAVQIANCVRDGAGKRGMTRAELLAAMGKAGIKTKQPLSQMLTYYTEGLTKESGVLTLETVDA